MRAMSAAAAPRAARTLSIARPPVHVDLITRTESLVVEVARRDVVLVGPRIEGVDAVRPAIHQARRDHRVLDAAAAKPLEHAPGVERRDPASAEEDARAGGRAVDAAEERRRPRAVPQLVDPPALEHVRDRPAAAEPRRRGL